MKRALLGASLLLAIAVLGGCPMYGSGTTSTCGSGDGCYYPGGPDGSLGCNTSADCGPGYQCDMYGSCVWIGYDAQVDCATTGCPAGMVCELANGVAQCVSLGAPLLPDASSQGDAGQAADGATAASDASVSGRDSSTVADASDASASPAPTACNADLTCGTQGARCIDGFCSPPSGLCSDGSQCANAGAACVDGTCLPRCSTSAPTCPDGYACDFNRNVCDVNPALCASSASCQGGSVCVEAHCVAPCTNTEAGPMCPAGLICVNHGCIPDQAAVFACQNDGQSGQLANGCTGQQICLHHDCYAACDVDAGASACITGLCKEVTVAAGTYAVCGTTTSLGSQCDPATGHLCSSGVCIDGYCTP